MQDEAHTLRIRNFVEPVVAGFWGQDAPSRAAPVAARVIRNGDVPSSRRIAVEDLPVRWFQRREVAKAEARASDTVVVSSGYIGKSANPPHSEGNVPVVVSNFVRRLRPKSGTDPRWLFHVIGTPAALQAMHRNAGGSTIVNLSSGYLDEPLDLLHADLPEQRRIAEILDTLDDAIRKTEQVIAKLQQMKQGLLHDLLTRGIDENGELRDPEQNPEQFKDSPIGRVPSEWDSGVAADWCDRLTVGVVNSATHAYAPRGVPFIRSQNVRPNRIAVEDLLYVTDGFNQQQAKSILRTDDVVIVRTGYPGTAAVVPAELSGSNCFSLVVATPTKHRLNPHFLAHFMNSSLCKVQVARMQFGSAQHNFNVGEMKLLPVALPSLEEQAAIVERITATDSCISWEETDLAKLRKLKQGLTDDLLTGRVRVPVPEAAIA